MNSVTWTKLCFVFGVGLYCHMDMFDVLIHFNVHIKGKALLDLLVLVFPTYSLP